MAVSLGAEVTRDTGPNTSHVIAVTTATRRVAEALAKGTIWVVSCDWLQGCLWALARLPEAGFSLGPAPSRSEFPSYTEVDMPRDEGRMKRIVQVPNDQFRLKRKRADRPEEGETMVACDLEREEEGNDQDIDRKTALDDDGEDWLIELEREVNKQS